MTATPGNGEEPVDDPMTSHTWGTLLMGAGGGFVVGAVSILVAVQEMVCSVRP